MRTKSLLNLLLLGVAWVGVATFLRAQTIPLDPVDDSGISHVPIAAPRAGEEIDLALLKNQLQQAGDASLIKKLAEDIAKNPEKFLSRDQIDKLREQYKQNADDRTPLNQPDPAKVKYYLENNPEVLQSVKNITPEQREKLQRLFQPGNSGMTSPSPDSPDPKTMSPVRPDTPPPSATNKPADTPPTRPNRPAPPPPSLDRPPPPPPPRLSPPQPHQDAGGRLTRWLNQLKSSEMKDWRTRLEGSPNLERAFRRIGQSLNFDDWSLLNRGQSGTESGGILANLGRLWSPSQDLPSFKPIRLPDFSTPGRSLSVKPPSSGSTLEFLVVLGLVIVVVFGLWKLSALARSRYGEGRAGFRLGPWPVAPGQVASREDLVRAFEYLSVLRLGVTARVWNHHHIASGLRGLAAARDGANEEATRRLAALYELARYMPPAEPLPNDGLAAARRDLCLLAGVTAA
jgi:hypothetical protein